ncbi:hypothetical protein A2U01_0060525, partial [Trifolium medium]|nr:hypothetical protein [Trifolium medium]
CNVCGKLKRDDDDLNIDDKGQDGVAIGGLSSYNGAFVSLPEFV